MDDERTRSGPGGRTAPWRPPAPRQAPERETPPWGVPEPRTEDQGRRLAGRSSGGAQRSDGRAGARLGERLDAVCAALDGIADAGPGAASAPGGLVTACAAAEQVLALLAYAVASPEAPESCRAALRQAADYLQPLRDGVDPGPTGLAELADEALAELTRARVALAAGPERAPGRESD